MSSGQADNLEAGVQVGDFRVEKRLGAGSMGIVYQARQVSLGRTVALKILGSALNRETDIARFRREAQAIAKLKHPGIAAVHFIGQDRQVCYIAMEFIEGVSLRKVIERLADLQEPGQSLDSVLQTIPVGEGEAPAVRFDEPTAAYMPAPALAIESTGPGPLTPEAKALVASPAYIRRCAEIVRAAALALGHAHEREVIHRDIKPENLLLDRQAQIHLIDFGVARFFEDASLTNTGALVGTPMYMSPEQVTGRIGVDRRTDIYSLGLVLYELLTLRRPITGPTRESVLRQIVTKALPPVTRWNRAVPRDLESVVHQATAKDPDQRYQTATEFAGDLQSWLGGQLVTAQPYRYRLDLGEIISARPPEAMFAGVWSFLAAASVGMQLALGMWHGMPIGKEIASMTMVAIACFAAGIGLLSGWRWAWYLTIALGVTQVIWTIVLFAHSSIPRADLDLLSLISLGWLATTVILLLPRPRQWIAFAERVRSEHRRTFGAPDSAR